MDQTKTHLKKKEKQKGVRNLSLFVIGGILLVYIALQFISACSTGILTVPARHVVINESFKIDAVFIRDEQVVSGNESETAKHSVSSGQRVQAGAALATMYTSEENLAKSEELEQVSQEIDLLRGVLQMTEGEVDPAKIDQLIAMQLQVFFSAVRNGNGNVVIKESEALRSLSLRRIAGLLDRDAINSQLAVLESKKGDFKQQLSESNAQITAESSGYFSEVVDGYETIYTAAILDSLTPEKFHDLQALAPSTVSSTSFGKIVKGFTWYLVAEIPLAQAQELSVNQGLHVDIISASIKMPVTVYAIHKSPSTEAATAVLILEGTQFDGDIVSMRMQEVEVIISTHSGLEVPKEAVRVQQNESGGTSQSGVYIVSGSFSSFKKIEIIYEADTYYVVKQTATDELGLVEQDQIIVRGKDIQDKMVVKYNG